MAKRIVDTSMLTAEANAIRQKGITGQIEFKSNGFADAILAIPSGGEEYEWDTISWEFPIQTGNRLYITQAYSVTASSGVVYLE